MSKVDAKVAQICIDISSEESSNSDSDFEVEVVPKKFVFKKRVNVNESSVSSTSAKTVSKPPKKESNKVVGKGKRGNLQANVKEVTKDHKLGPRNQVVGKKIHPFFSSSSSTSSSSTSCSPCPSPSPSTTTSTSKRESDEENRGIEGTAEVASDPALVVNVDADADEDNTYLAKVVNFEKTKSKWKDLMGLMQRNQNQNRNKDQSESKKGFKRQLGGDNYFGQSFNKRVKMDSNQAQLSTLTLSGATARPIVPRIRKDLTRPFYGNGEQIDIVSSSTSNDQAKEAQVVENPRKYPCPLYKKMPGTRFSVDAFSYGVIPDIDVYFLSHFHSDHYQGLKKSFSKTLICTQPTANLVRMKLYVSEENIRRLELNKVYIIQGTEVVLIDANHCPGSVMFIFRLPNGTTFFHTGDFRYTSDMLDNHFLQSLRIDCLYLDTTYCDPKYNFPSQTDAIQHVISLVKRHIDYRPKTLIVCGSYVIGKERVFINIADSIGSKVFCVKDKMRVLRALENSSFNSFLCDTENNANIHVVPMANLKPSDLATYLEERKSLYTNILGIKPTGWTFGWSGGGGNVGGNGFSIKKHFNDTVTLISVPYSEHSSFSELKEFVTVLNPIKVQPTVNASKKEELLTIINQWIKG